MAIIHFASNRSSKDCSKSSSKTYSNPTGFGNPHEIIEHYLNSLPTQAKEFILQNQHQLTVRKLASFWSSTHQIDNATNFNLTSSLCITSWYLALNYILLQRFTEATAFIINGAFLNQCCTIPINEIVDLCDTVKNDYFIIESLPYVGHGFAAIESQSAMERFIKARISAESQRAMALAASEQKNATIANYVDDMFNDSRKTSHNKRRNSAKDEDCTQIEIIFADVDDERKLCIGSSMTMKSLFNEYADERGISLRSVRLTYDGGTLFLSSVGKKTPQELGMKDLDVIHVRSLCSQSQQGKDAIEKANAAPLRKNAKKSRKKKAKRTKGATKATHCRIPVVDNYDEECKILHSEALTRLFEEAGAQFKKIREGLTARNLERRPSKDKSQLSRGITENVLPVFNPLMNGVGGKAGKSTFTVQVGEVENLYKMTKPSSLRKFGRQAPQTTTVDLHGFTRSEAMAKLDAGLLEWNDIAMEGSYPWVIPVTIICGGGNQILSEAVGNWIKQNNNVANAPKNIFSVR